MAFTRLEPTGVNTTATFTFANANITTNLNVGGVSNLGPVGNIIITGGTSGQVLSTNGSGGLSWTNQTGGGGGGTNYSNSNVAAYLPTFTGNVSAAYFIGNGSTLTSLTGGNVVGQVGNALVAGTVYTAAQPNITSVGTLNGITITGVANLINSSNVSLGPVGNVKITGGSAGHVLSTDGSGSLSWVAQSGGGGGSVTASQFVVKGTLSANQSLNTASDTLVAFNTKSFDPQNWLNTTSSLVTPTIAGYYKVTFFAWFTQGTSGAGSQYNIQIRKSSTSSGTTAISQTPIAGTNGQSLGVSDTVYMNGSTDYFAFSAYSSVAGQSLQYVNGTYFTVELIGSAAATSNINNGTSNVNIGTANANIQFGVNGTSNIAVMSNVGVSITGNLNTSGNTTSTYFIGNGSSLTSITGGNVTGQVANALVAGTVYTAAQPSITSLGTLSSLSVTGNISTTGNVIGTHYGNGYNLSGLFGSNVLGQVANSLVASTVYSNAQPNITSVGTLSSLTVTANANVGNLSSAGTLVVAGNTEILNQGNINLSWANHTIITNFDNSYDYRMGMMLVPDSRETRLFATGTGVLSGADGGRITFYTRSAGATGGIGDVGTERARINVDGLRISTTTTATSTSTGSIVTSGGIGAAGNLFVGGITTVSGNVTGSYFIGNGAALTSITGSSVVGQVGNALVAGTVYTAAQPSITSLGTLTSLNVSGNISTAGNVIGTHYGNGYNLSGLFGSNVIGQVGNALVAGTVYTAAQPSITSLGTLSSLSVAGNISTAGNIIGNGQFLTGITGGNVTGQVANALIAGTIYSNAQPNITSLGTLTSLSVSGNVSAGNVLTNNLLYANGVAWSFSSGSNYSNANVAAYLPTYTGNVSANFFQGNGSLLSSLTGANVTGQVANALIAGTVYTAAQPSITSVGTLTSLSVSGLTTATGGIRTGNIQDSLGTNTISVSASTVSMIGNLTVGTGGTGNITATYFIGNGATLTSINGSNVTGTVSSATSAGTVTANAQPNITSTGTLNSVTATGTVNFIGASNVSLGPVGNVKITGGISGQYLQTDGTGTLSWATVSAGSTNNISNGTSNVNIATSGGNVTTSVGGNANIFVVTSTGANINGNLAITGSMSAGSGVGGSLSGANSISANYFIGNGSLLTGITASTINYYSRNYYWAGPVTVNTGTTRLYLPLNSTLVNAYFNLATAGTSNTVVATERNGVIIANTTLGSNVSSTFTTFNTGMSINDYLTVDVTTAGASAVDLYITYVFTTT